MRLGFVGPSRGDVQRLRALAELLLFELRADRAIYLGPDDALDRAVPGWAEHLGAPADDDAFLREAALLAPDAPPEALEALLARDARRQRLADLAALPGAHDRCVEMIDGRLILMVYDKSVLDEEDIANAAVVVHGQGPRADLRTIGVRGFLAPGWAAGGHVGVIDAAPDGLVLGLHDSRGDVVQQARLALARGGRLEVRHP